MADTDIPQGEAPKKRSKLPLLLGFVLALAGGGGGYFAVQAGLIPLGGAGAKESATHGAEHGAADDGHGADEAYDSHDAASAPDVDFVPVEPLVISLNDGRGTHLRFRAQLEVRPGRKAEVMHLLPRVVDVLNGYLRAVDLADLQDNAALVRLRAQMLRRVQVVTGGDLVSDLLIMEFVLN
ncbi:MAG: flagellar basal body-associated FliL family protein [Roseovarius sp.]